MESPEKIISKCIRTICFSGRIDETSAVFSSPILTPELLLLAVKFCTPYVYRDALDDSTLLSIANSIIPTLPNGEECPEQRKLGTDVSNEEAGRLRCWKEGFHISVYEKASILIAGLTQPFVTPVKNQVDILKKEKARLLDIHANPNSYFPRKRYEIRDGVKSIGKKCTLYRKLGQGVVQCINCYHHCVLNPGPPDNSDPEEVDPRSMIGICGARHNWRGDLYLIDHSRMRPIAQCVDHVEKTPLFHFYPAERTYYIGTIGCNMRCSFCISWETSQSSKISLKRKKNGYIKDIEDLTLQDMPPEALVENALKKNCKIIEYNVFNEATISFDTYFYETAKLAKEKGLLNVVCTNAYQSLHSIELVAPYIDAVSIGLKSCRNDFYSRECGVRLKPIQRNIKIWHDLGIWVEIQSLIIPGETDTDEEIENLAKFVYSVDPNIVLHFSQYKKDYKFMEKDHPDLTPDETLIKAMKIGKAVGLNYVYCDVRKTHAFTLCPNCEKGVVSRGYVDKVWKGIVFGIDKDGKCKECGGIIHGLWSDSMKFPLVPRKLESVPQEYRDVPLFTEKNLQKRTIKVVFASQTGVSEEFAKELATFGSKSTNEQINLIDLVNYDETQLEKERIIIIVVSTYFFGRIPRSGERFLKYLMQRKEKLENLVYCVVGIGSTGNKKCHLDTYQVVPRQIRKRLEELGAKELTKINCEANKKFQFRESLERIKKNIWNCI